MPTVVALYANGTKANNVAHRLIDSGFSKDQISVLAGNTSTEAAELVEDPTVAHIATAEGYEGDDDLDAAEGAGLGAVAGGVTGLLLSAAALTVPGIGPLLALGPLAATLTGGVVGALTGGVVAALTDVGVSPEDAEYYVEHLRRGNVLVSVHTTDHTQAEAAATLMRQHAPIDFAGVEDHEIISDHQDEVADKDPYFNEVTNVLNTGEQAPVTDQQQLDSANVPDLDEESRAYMTNLDSDSTGSLEPAPDRAAAAIPNEERHPARDQHGGHYKEAAEPGGVRVYGVDVD